MEEPERIDTRADRNIERQRERERTMSSRSAAARLAGTVSWPWQTANQIPFGESRQMTSDKYTAPFHDGDLLLSREIILVNVIVRRSSLRWGREGGGHLCAATGL